MRCSWINLDLFFGGEGGNTYIYLLMTKGNKRRSSYKTKKFQWLLTEVDGVGIYMDLNWNEDTSMFKSERHISKNREFAYLHFSAFAGSFLNLIFCNLSLNFSEGIYYTGQVFINGNIEYW